MHRAHRAVSLLTLSLLPCITAAQATQNTPGTPQTPPQPAVQAPRALTVPDMPTLSSKTLDNGIVIDEMKIGDGYEVKAGDAVVAHYHGTLKSDPAKVFDSSFQRGEPIGFPLNNVIKGWQDGVPGMKVGGVRKLTIPAALAYGDASPSPDIPANSDLVFIIQLEDALHVEDVKIGDGETATEPCLPITAYVVKDKDGKEIERCNSDKPHVWIPGEYYVPAFGFDPLQAAIKGMKVGGKRKVHIPAEFNSPNPGLATTRPANVDLEFEVDLINVRNLPNRGG